MTLKVENIEITTLRGEKRFLNAKELHFLEALKYGHLVQDTNPNNKGVFYWAKNRGYKRIKIGDIAGSLNSRGYSRIIFKGKQIYGHSLSFLNKHGYIPNLIDHKNGIKYDNYWENLHDATYSENSQNIKLASKNSKSGHKGIHWSKGSKKWHVQITINYRKIYLGLFSELSDAIKMRKQGESEYFNYEHKS